MSSDVAEVEKVLQVYFDGLYEGDARKLGAAFHPSSHLYSVAPTARPPTFAHRLVQDGRGRKSAKATAASARPHRLDRLLRSRTAFRQGRVPDPPRYFTDYLTLLKVVGRCR